jgi:hypothetical protein
MDVDGGYVRAGVSGPLLELTEMRLGAAWAAGSLLALRCGAGVSSDPSVAIGSPASHQAVEKRVGSVYSGAPHRSSPPGSPSAWQRPSI